MKSGQHLYMLMTEFSLSNYNSRYQPEALPSTRAVTKIPPANQGVCLNELNQPQSSSLPTRCAPSDFVYKDFHKSLSQQMQFIM